LTSARRFLEVAYPRLTSPVVLKVVETPVAQGNFGFRRFSLFVNETEFEPSYSADVLLRAEFTFDQTDKVETYIASGRLLREAENRKFAAVVEAHPEWSVDKMGEELRQRGAQFGPDRGEALLDGDLSSRAARA
jgi:hypothetical protein